MYIIYILREKGDRSSQLINHRGIPYLHNAYIIYIYIYIYIYMCVCVCVCIYKREIGHPQSKEHRDFAYSYTAYICMLYIYIYIYNIYIYIYMTGPHKGVAQVH